MELKQTAEARRVEENTSGQRDWSAWGPYLSERQWGTVREDYSAEGDAWRYFPHDMARRRAYRWGEDGIAGFCDREQRLCLALALWNGADPILKERLFGVTNSEGNHGEDVKELYYYLDATPSHAYLRMLYKYPQRAFPYQELLRQNAARGRHEREYELTDTGVFADNGYFDVFVEYAKADVDDIVMRVTAINRGSSAASLWLLPQLWFRNTWSWAGPTTDRPLLRREGSTIALRHPTRGKFKLSFDAGGLPLFCENESGSVEQRQKKDAFHRYVCAGDASAVNPEAVGSKAAIQWQLSLGPGQQTSVRLRLSPGGGKASVEDVDAVLDLRRLEADAFYGALQAKIPDEDQRRVQRQALAGMIWGKQWYGYDVERWLEGDSAQPPPPQGRKAARNSDWRHLNNADIISMPDTWEYPWYAVWDLAFHCIPLAMVDPCFAKQQLKLFTREWYMHPNGQLPAYEWDFGDVNPPVHAWATWRVFQIDRKHRGDRGDIAFLESVFHKLMLNFTWWVNRKDVEGHNIFQGGFLGLDNIGVFDRSKPLPTGGHINQADGTSWMAMYSLNLLRIALELALHNRVYEDIATKFFEHFLHIAEAMTNMRGARIGLWNEEDGFYYDELIFADGAGGYHATPLKVRSLVGIIPLFAVETIEPETLRRLPNFAERLDWVLSNKPALAALVSRWHEPGRGDRRLLSLLRGHRMKRLLRRMLDPEEFLSDYGIRSLSKSHLQRPYVFEHRGQRFEVRYNPSDSDSGMFGGNSNWRGPIWMPVNFLIIESLQKFHHYYGDDFKVECPTGTGNYLTIDGVAQELSRRVSRIFLRDPSGCRPLYGEDQRLQQDPQFRDYLLFHEYFHGDSGRGLGASHQTGWTGLVAKLLQPRCPPPA